MPKINATWNPSDMNGAMTLSNGNLTIVSAIAATGAGNIRATHGKTSGKWYWEIKLDAGGTTLFAGIASKSYPITSVEYIGSSSDALKIRAYYGNNGNKLPENVSYGATSAVGDTIGVAMNLDIGTLEFYKNGVSMGVSHTNLQGMGEVFPFFKSMGTVSRTITANFGATAFSYPIPSGFKAYNDERVDKFLISSGDGNFYSTTRSILSSNIIPAMTSNTTPSGIASASSINSAAYDAWKAFDKADTTNGWMSSTGIISGWLAYEFSETKLITEYTLKCNTATPQRMPKNWTLEGSNDNFTTFDILDSRTNEASWVDTQIREYSFKNTKKYKNYRINITANNGATDFVCIGEMALFEYTPSSLKILSSVNVSEQKYIAHGMDGELTINLSEGITKKVFVEDIPTTLGSGKIFKQKIDTSKIPIKKASIT